jgi:uncharacterized membrane protein YeaQ/YmgE (transglycosylase-associated protein family)
VILAVFIALVVIFVLLPILGVALWWLISTLVVGLIVGALGRLIVPGHNPIGFLPTVACGLIGALVGGAIGDAIGGRFVTVLVEVGLAAAAVAVWSATHREEVAARRRRSISRMQ